MTNYKLVLHVVGADFRHTYRSRNDTTAIQTALDVINDLRSRGLTLEWGDVVLHKTVGVAVYPLSNNPSFDRE